MLDHRVVTRQWLNVPLIYTPSFLFVYQGEWWGGGVRGVGGGVTSHLVCGSDWLKGINHSGVCFYGLIIHTNS